MGVRGFLAFLLWFVLQSRAIVRPHPHVPPPRVLVWRPVLQHNARAVWTDYTVNVDYFDVNVV